MHIMFRACAYSIAGCLVGAFVSFSVSTLIFGGIALGWIVFGAGAGTAAGLAIASYVTRRHLIGDDFIRSTDIAPLGVVAEISLRGIVPRAGRARAAEWLQEQLQRWTGGHNDPV